MPDIAVHKSMGRKVYKKLGMKLDLRAFRFGLLGPDPYLFCLPVICRYSSIMHRRRTGAFLLEMAKRCRTNSQFSYLAGFLCHYALDSATHPLIIQLAQKDHGDNWIGSMMHIAIEHRMDVLDGSGNARPPFPPEETMRFFYQSVYAVYGWKDARKKFRHGYHCMPAFYLFVRDKYGLFDKVTGWTKGPAAMISGKSKICDGIDFSGIYPLYERSIDDAVLYIRCAYDFVKHRIGEEEFRKTIGNKSYLEESVARQNGNTEHE